MPPTYLCLALISLCVVVILMSAACADDTPVYRDKLNVMVYRDEMGQDHPVQTPEDWAIRRAHILAEMGLVMGPMPDDSRRVNLDPQITEEVAGEKWTRYQLTYVSEPGDRVPAYLFIPKGLSGKVPAVLCLHQTTQIGKGEPAGLGGLDNLHYARELAERGLVTLAPDYPNFGDYVFDPYVNGYVSATMKGIWNHRRALDLLQSLPEVDSEKLGCLGHSLGGHNTLYLAAHDERVKVAVTSCGFNSFAKYMGGDLSGWSHKGYMPRIADLYHCNPAEMPFDFTEVLAAIAPRAVYINAPTGDDNFEVSGVKDCIFAAGPVYGLLGAADKLVAEHPDCAHDFPPDTRERVYTFITQALQ